MPGTVRGVLKETGGVVPPKRGHFRGRDGKQVKKQEGFSLSEGLRGKAQGS